MFINVKNEFGLKTGLVKYFYYSLLTKLGFFARYKKINWGKVKRLVFVCQGNICRSPFAEYYARNKKNIETTSFGIDSDGKSSADPDALATAKLFSIEIETHISKKQNDISFSSHDLIICMEPVHIKRLRELERSTEAQFTLLGLWSEKENPYIQDPLCLNRSYFQKCFEVIVDAINKLSKNIYDYRHQERGG